VSKFKFKFQVKFKISMLVFPLLFSLSAQAGTQTGKYFDRVMFVIFENTNYSAAMKQPFFAQLAGQGANFSNFLALVHPSQGNYIALTSGSVNGVSGDGNVNLNVSNIIDLLEAKNLTWKVYAEDYPGNCFLGGSSGNYARKHNPLISYVDIQKSPARCGRIVNATEFDRDRATGSLPNYFFYIPNLKNDGHDTGVAFADKWYSQKLTPLLADKAFMKNTVIVSTFDESGSSAKNQIYTSLVGPAVKAGDYPQDLNIYSLLNLIEQNWNLGDLGKFDGTATPIPSIWN
jgi:hypothetical protein